jgi:hypothetical protein
MNAVTLPADILVNICEQLESFSTVIDILTLMYEMNGTILALSGVCRSWHYHITNCKSLFHNIAFDVSSDDSIVTSGVFLGMLKGTEVPINVYARLGQSFDPDPMISRLFVQLRSHIPRIAHFEYDGDMARYRSYLDAPAPNLRFFSDNFDTYPGSGLPLFRGQMPRVQFLTTLSMAPQALWTTLKLSNLTTLNLGFLGADLRVPLSSFLNLLRGSPRLGSLHVQHFVPTIHPTKDPGEVFLPCLRRLSLYHNDLHTILKHLRVPALRKVFFVGESHSVSNEKLNPTLEAPHLFAGLPLLPIFEKPIESVLLKTTGNRRTSLDLLLRLIADGGFEFQVSLYCILDSIPLFDGYVKRSVLELVRMMTLAPRAQVELFHAHLTPSDEPIYLPFLSTTNIDQLTIRGGFVVEVLRRLTLHTGVHHLLPRLRFLNIADQVPFSGEEGRTALLSCLESRAAEGFHLSVRLMGSGFSCSDFSQLGCIVNRESQDYRDSLGGVSEPSR